MLVNLKRVHRVFKAHGLQVRRRPKKHEYKGLPWASPIRWTLVEKPPRVCPGAWV